MAHDRRDERSGDARADRRRQDEPLGKTEHARGHQRSKKPSGSGSATRSAKTAITATAWIVSAFQNSGAFTRLMLGAERGRPF